MGKTSFSQVKRGPDGRLYRVFSTWEGLYQFMMQVPHHSGVRPSAYNRYAHCAIIRIGGYDAIEVEEVPEDVRSRGS